MNFMRKLKSNHLALGFPLVVIFLIGWYGLNDHFERIEKRLAQYTTEYIPEKMYVQTDKPYYTSGDTIWFQAYLVEAITHLTIAQSKLAYIELIAPDSSRISQRQLLIESGTTNGELILPEDAKSGNYLLRAYTNHMRNQGPDFFYEQDIPVWFQTTEERAAGALAEVEGGLELEQHQERPEVLFFPEGGDLVAGIPSVLGVKTLLSSGYGYPMEGRIVDESGATKAQFKTYKFGIGSFSFLAEMDKKYAAIVEFNGVEQTYPLPLIKSQGYVLNVRNQKDKITIRGITNIANGLEGAFITGHLRGELFCHVTNEESGGTLAATISKESLLDGVATFTLFTKNGEPVCERLTYVDSSKEGIKVELNTDQPAYKKRNKVEVTLEVKDFEGTTDSLAKLSLSVTDNKLVKGNPYRENIKTWLLLNSDLRGEIEDPNYFFEASDDRRRSYLLDALMLTHGWRRFTWKPLLEEEQPFATQYKIEQGVYFNGRITKPGNEKKGMAANVFLSALEAGIFLNQTTSDEQGEFNLGPYIIEDPVDIVIEAREFLTEREKARLERKPVEGLPGGRNLSILLDTSTVDPPKIRVAPPIRPFSDEITASVEQFLIGSQLEKRMNRQYDTRLILLDEVQITGSKKKKETVFEQRVKTQSLYREPSNRVMLDSIPSALSAQSVFDLLRRVPGVQVSGFFPNQSAQIRGINTITLSSAPTYVLDGLIVDESLIQTYPVPNVLFIDVLKGAAASVYGGQGANGVIVIYSRERSAFGPTGKTEPGVIAFQYGGVYKAREFYAPDYSVKEDIHIKPDYRTTLFWAPNIRTQDGKVVVSFYTADNASSYNIRVEGLSSTGVPVFVEKTFAVEE